MSRLRNLVWFYGVRVHDCFLVMTSWNLPGLSAGHRVIKKTPGSFCNGPGSSLTKYYLVKLGSGGSHILLPLSEPSSCFQMSFQMFTVSIGRYRMNTAFLSYSHRKSNLSESSEFTSYDVFADVFRKGGTCIGPYRTKSNYGKCREVVALDLNHQLCHLDCCSSVWRLITQ